MNEDLKKRCTVAFDAFNGGLIDRDDLATAVNAILKEVPADELRHMLLTNQSICGKSRKSPQ